MNRADLQRLARARLRDAKALLAARRWSGAYYLAGYAVECGLKACIAKRTKAEDFPDRTIAQKCWTHNLVELVEAAGLKDVLKADTAADSDLSASWAIVKDWNESSRYTRKTRIKAQTLYNAITDKKGGMFQWIKSHW